MTQSIRIRTWLLRKPDFNEADIIWCKSWSNKFSSANSHYSRVRGIDPAIYFGERDISIETTSKEQESMLKLKYGDGLILLMEEYMLDDWRPCTLSEINF